MSDIAVAAEQDAIAESLLGEPEESTVEETGAEQPEIQEAEPQVQQDEPNEPQLEDDPNWLPDEQQKVFPAEVLERYAPRYGFTPNDLSDPRISRIVQEKLNTDIFVNQLQQQLEQQNALAEIEPEPEPTQPLPQLTADQYFASLQRIAAERTAPEAAQRYHAQFLKSFGVPDADIAKAPKEQALAFGQLMTEGVLNILNTFGAEFIQQHFQSVLAQAFPDFGEMYERSAYGMAWDRVRNSDPRYAELPNYGTKEFAAKLKEAEAKFPELMSAFADQEGTIPPAKAQAAYSLLARIAVGQQIDPAQMQRAVAAHVNNLRKADVRRANANLGSGQSKAASGQRNSSQFQTNTDIFDQETMDIYQREHGRL